MKKRALLSVTNKTGIVEFAKQLVELGFEVVSTGGTAGELLKHYVPCKLVEEVTGFPEMLNGRVKTLHPKIFAGIIADQGNLAHMQTIAGHGIEAFGLVVVNLYDFAQNPGIETIDVGGPSMIRAAAKNYNSVAVVVDPTDYHEVVNELKENGNLSEQIRFVLATKAFRATADYDARIAEKFEACYASGTRPRHGAH